MFSVNNISSIIFLSKEPKMNQINLRFFNTRRRLIQFSITYCY